MRPLSADDIVRLWEIGQDRHPVDRALSLLRYARPESSWQDLSALPLGSRDALLYSLRERTFGGTMNARVACPACGESMELALSTSALRVEPPQDTSSTLEADGFQVRFRLPNTFDLAAVAQAGNPRAGLARIVARCVSEAHLGGDRVSPGELPAAIVERLAALMAEQDPQAEVLLDLVCAACEHRWQSLLDIADFLWKEVSAEAVRLLGEVHTLARAYHWHEADILAMSDRRRQAYLEMVGA